MSKELQQSIGMALIILAILLGIGGCFRLGLSSSKCQCTEEAK